jgi:hypothetical protein
MIENEESGTLVHDRKQLIPKISKRLWNSSNIVETKRILENVSRTFKILDVLSGRFTENQLWHEGVSEFFWGGESLLQGVE